MKCHTRYQDKSISDKLLEASTTTKQLQTKKQKFHGWIEDEDVSEIRTSIKTGVLSQNSKSARDNGTVRCFIQRNVDAFGSKGGEREYRFRHYNNLLDYMAQYRRDHVFSNSLATCPEVTSSRQQLYPDEYNEDESDKWGKDLDTELENSAVSKATALSATYMHGAFPMGRNQSNGRLVTGAQTQPSNNQPVQLAQWWRGNRCQAQFAPSPLTSRALMQISNQQQQQEMSASTNMAASVFVFPHVSENDRNSSKSKPGQTYSRSDLSSASSNRFKQFPLRSNIRSSKHRPGGIDRMLQLQAESNAIMSNGRNTDPQKLESNYQTRSGPHKGLPAGDPRDLVQTTVVRDGQCAAFAYVLTQKLEQLRLVREQCDPEVFAEEERPSHTDASMSVKGAGFGGIAGQRRLAATQPNNNNYNDESDVDSISDFEMEESGDVGDIFQMSISGTATNLIHPAVKQRGG